MSSDDSLDDYIADLVQQLAEARKLCEHWATDKASLHEALAQLTEARDELAEANAVIERIRVSVDAKLVEWRAIAESEK